MLVIPIARTNHMIGDTQFGELAVQHITEGPRLVTADHPPSLRDLLFNPFEQTSRRETLRRLGTAVVLLKGNDLPDQVRVNRDFK